MKIAAAQTIPHDNDIAANLKDHYRLATAAAGLGVQLLIFPEMSLTGYQRADAKKMAFEEQDERLGELRGLSISKNIILVAGAPIEINGHLHIGTFILSPDGSQAIYTKQFLHEGEELFFSTVTGHDPKIYLADNSISIAICADIVNPQHPKNAAACGTTIYAAGIFYTPGGIIKGHEGLGAYAKEHAMHVLMANYGGPSWGMDSGGRSAFWTKDGMLKGELPGTGEGLLIATKENKHWYVDRINL
ncbi:MAG: Nitrilase/cyanide hydratase and apolipoprotein N-acyltransferase [Flavipsychrobacter sp.]|nr:Nitrilase/cyanide hydratase and apolipoprotein N-acyltransferase [Flavipsychrobacter sp.]